MKAPVGVWKVTEVGSKKLFGIFLTKVIAVIHVCAHHGARTYDSKREDKGSYVIAVDATHYVIEFVPIHGNILEEIK